MIINDGFNERTNYIHNSNDLNKLKKAGPTNFDNSFAKMRVRENRPDIKTTNQDNIIIAENVRGNKDNFILRNNNIMNANIKVNQNNPVSDAMNRNHFKKF